MGAVTVLRRRKFLGAAAGIGASAAGLAVLGGRALIPGQSPPKVQLIGFLHSIAPPGPGAFDAFSQGLREQGLIEGQNLHIEWRWAEGQNERLPALATELVGLGVRLIVAGGATAPSVVRQVTDRVPIVLYMSARDPIAQGFAESLARPGGNVTGTLRFGTAASVKAVELLRALVPSARRLVHMTNFTAPGEDLTRDALAAVAERLGLQFRDIDVQSQGQLEPAFEDAQVWGADLVNVVNIVPLNMPRDLVPALAARAQLPASCGAREWVEAGLLLSYSDDARVLARRTAWYVARILDGADPAELPMERSTAFELLVSRTTLANLGLTIPPDVASQVTEWIA
jgi:ABC-type uncharacterized transport system substrate-binding protein